MLSVLRGIYCIFFDCFPLNCRYREQVGGQDYSFVSNPAKRKFFMSVPRTSPDKQGE